MTMDELVCKIARECGQHAGRNEYFVGRIEWAREALLDKWKDASARQAIVLMLLSDTLDYHKANPIGDVTQ